MRILPVGSAISFDDQNPQSSSGSGQAEGTFAGEVLSVITDDNERVRAAFKTPGGLTHVGTDDQRHIATTAAMVVTDRRVLFMTDPSADLDPESDVYAVTYADIGAVSVVGDDRDILSISTAGGERWQFPLPETDPDTVGAVVRHLRWVGELRSRLLAAKNDVELAAGEIRDHAAAMDWEDAEATYEEMRQRIDRLVMGAQWTEPIDDDVIAPELTTIERKLEYAYARLFVERAHSQLELGTQLVENEDYDQGQTVLQAAREHYERAADRADAVERGDAFRFGEQRELQEELDRLRWEIEAVAAEPIRQAHEARILGTNADDPAVAVDHWEAAFRRYGTVLSLEWGDDGCYFPGDPDEIQADMAAVGDRLVECHRELARDRWDQGIQAEQDGEVKEAIRACSDAVEHLERARELATEFRPEDADDIGDRRQRMEQAVEAMRETAPVEHPDTAPAGDEPATDDPEAETGAEDDLLDIDTHQDITLDMDIEEQATDSGTEPSLSEQIAEGEPDQAVEQRAADSGSDDGDDAQKSRSEAIVEVDSDAE